MIISARTKRWARPVAGVAALGALATLPIIGGCAGVDTANAADATLERFTSCAALNEYAQSEAIGQAGPYGLGGGSYRLEDLARDSVTSATAPANAAPEALRTSGADAGSAAKAPGVDFSTTNVQEAGVDEPDIVKTDGTRIFALAKNRLYAIDASGPTPTIAGSIALPKDVFGRDMLISGNTLVVLGDGPVTVRPLPAGSGDDAVAKGRPGGFVDSTFPAFGGGSVLTKVDVTDIAAMKVVETFQTEARYINARLTGTTARIVVASGAPMGVAFRFATSPEDEQAATAANRNALRRTTADNWLPRFTVTTATGTSAPAPLAECESVSRPRQFSGLGTLTVLTVDLARGLSPIDSDSVMASGENVYASTQALYVATNRWPTPRPDGTFDPNQVTTTEVHKFDIANSSATDYRGSGSVVGNLLNQFSMSEHDGVLRVATTEAGQGLVGGDAVVESGRESESYVSTMAERNGKLVGLGQVGGLGKGERIFAVRFIGPTGYVVTFKQTDPLYVVDLSDPAAPAVRGELKIAGYSAYLHPIGDNLLIGVGQDATEEGRTTGLQVSLFDVSDPGSPKRLRNAVLPGASSEAEWDHRAFLWWPASQLAVVPYQRFTDIAVPSNGAPGTEPGVVEPATAPAVGLLPQIDAGVLGMRVTRDSIDEAGRVTHPADPMFGAGVRRSLVIGDTLFTLSDAGLKASALDGFAERTWLPFT